MGKITGFLEFDREENIALDPKDRIKNFDEFHKPIFDKNRQQQASRCMNCGVPFCQYGQPVNGSVIGCPLNNLIPEWNDLLFLDNYPSALKRLLKTNNFPEFTSRVCPALCEKACTCSLNGESVTVRDNEYTLIEYGYKNGLIKPRIPELRTDKRIAVVGSGPAGLSVADMLNQRGHNVTIFEKDDRPGGLLMYGIPNMKLEKHIIDRKVRLLKKEGINFELNHGIDSTKKANQLFKDYDAIVLACGAQKPRDLNVPGRDGKGIHFAVDYLTSITKSLLDSDLEDHKYIETKGKKVIVIGGGDTGNDCIGSAIRLGAASVLQLEMMPEPPLTRAENNPWPEWPRVKKTDYGQEEAIEVFGSDPRMYQTTIESVVLDEKKNVIGANLIHLEPVMENGRMMMKPIEGSKEFVECDMILIAMGFVGTNEKLYDYFGIEKSLDGFKTSKPNVYMIGDMRRGPSLVVYAIQEGRKAASLIDYDLMGYTNM